MNLYPKNLCNPVLVVDSGVPSSSSLALDENGAPHFSYVRRGSLRYTFRDIDDHWYFENVQDYDSIGTVSLALDGNGHPHIGYHYGEHVGWYNWHYSLGYAYRDDSGWHVETVDRGGDTGRLPSLVVDKFGISHITYNNYQGGYTSHGILEYAYRDISGWHIQTVANRGEYSSLALGPNSNLYISYYHPYDTDLKYAYYTPVIAWTIETADKVDNTGLFTSLALDDNDDPHISHYRGFSFDSLSGSRLRYTHKKNGNWYSEFVDSSNWLGKYSSLVLDSAGYPHISYFDEKNSQVKYISKNQSGWEASEVAAEAKIGGTSLKLDTDGNPHIAHYAANSFNGNMIRHIVKGTSVWYGESIELGIGDSSRGISLFLDRQNFPHIAYYDSSVGDLKYAYKSSSWHIETVDSAGDVGDDTALFLDDSNNPHISYYDKTNDDLKYAYKDSSGWHIETVDSDGDVGRYSSIAVDHNGQPHISYSDASNQSLKYAIKTASGWQIEVIDDSGNVGQYTSLALDSQGYPHISYYDESSGNLKYARKGIIYSISGYVRYENDQPVSGVVVSVNDSNDATTNSDGYYTLSRLSAGTYTVTAFKDNYRFSPDSHAVTLPPDATNQDFIVRKQPLILVHGFQGTASTPLNCYPDKMMDNEIVDYNNLPPADESSGWNYAKDYWEPMAEWLENNDDGYASYDVWIAQFKTGWKQGTASLEYNAECLMNQINYVYEQTGQQEMIIVAHSMGGLVSRAAISHDHNSRDKIESLITLGSPHAGLPNAAIIRLLVVTCVNLNFKLEFREGWQIGACQMSPNLVRVFNGYTPNRYGIKYFFLGGNKTNEEGWLWRVAGQNDGLVGKYSSVGWIGKFWSPWEYPLASVTHPLLQPELKEFKPDGWESQSYPVQIWTDEVHSRYYARSTQNQYLDYRKEDPDRDSKSYAYSCLIKWLNKESLPSFCEDATKLERTMSTTSAFPNLSQFTNISSGHIASGQSVSHTLQIDTNDASLLRLSWVTGTLKFTLTHPSGRIIDADYVAAHPQEVSYRFTPGVPEFLPHITYFFTDTTPGLWQLNITAGNVGSDGTTYQAFAALESNRFLVAGTDRDTYAVGQTAVLSAVLQNDSDGLSGATVKALITRSGGATDTLTLTEQGGGIYKTTYSIPDAPGFLSIAITASGNDDGVFFTRQVELSSAIAPHNAHLTGDYTERARDDNGDGLFEYLDISAEIITDKPGNYVLAADLEANGQLIAHTGFYTSLITGTQTLVLRFNGDDIRYARLNGPYIVTNLHLVSSEMGLTTQSATDVWATQVYNWRDFGSSPTSEGVNYIYLPLILKGGAPPAPTPTPGLPTLVNGDFEDGPGGWGEFSSNNYALVTDDTSAGLPAGFTARSGKYVAWLGGADNETSVISQTVYIPAGGSLSLHYYYQLRSEDACGNDYARVLVNGVVAAQYDLCAGSAVDNWTLGTIDLSPYTGQTVSLQFRTTTNSASYSSFFVDDVSFAVPPATPTATSTSTAATAAPTETATPTPTATSTPVCASIIQNGNFEEASLMNLWKYDSVNQQVNRTSSPHFFASGESFSMILPATTVYGSPRQPWLYQTFTMPVWIQSGSSLTLSLRVAVNPEGTAEPDPLYVSLRNQNGILTNTGSITLATGADTPPIDPDNPDPNNSEWLLKTINLADVFDPPETLLNYKGKNLRLFFESPNPAGAYSTRFYLDNVGMEICK